MNLVTALAATEDRLPPIVGLYQYLVCGDGLYVRAESEHVAACVPVAAAALHGLGLCVTYSYLKPRIIPGDFLFQIFANAVRSLPGEAMYQFIWSAGDANWNCQRPAQTRSPAAVEYTNHPLAVVDLHSHGSMPAFFSDTDDHDERGLRFYGVIGKIDTSTPEIAMRVGVFGHCQRIPASTVFDHLGPFIDTHEPE